MWILTSLFCCALIAATSTAQAANGSGADRFRGLTLNQTSSEDAMRILGQPAADKVDRLDASKVSKWLDPKHKEKIFRQLSFKNVGDFSQIQLSILENKLMFIELAFKKNVAPERVNNIFGVEFATVGGQGVHRICRMSRVNIRFASLPTLYPFSYNMIGISDKGLRLGRLQHGRCAHARQNRQNSSNQPRSRKEMI